MPTRRALRADRAGQAAALATCLLLLAGCSDSTTDARAQDSGADAADTGAAQPPGRLALSADWLNGSISLLDFDALLEDGATREQALIERVDLGDYAAAGPYSITLTPDGSRAVILLSEGAGATLAPLVGIDASTIPVGEGAVVIFDIASRDVLADFPSAAAPFQAVIDPEGERAYVTSLGNDDDGTLSVFDLQALTKLEEIAVASFTEGVALSPDGNRGVVIGATSGLQFFDPLDVEASLSAPLQIAVDSSSAVYLPGGERLVVANSRDPASYALLDVSLPGEATVLVDAQPPGGFPFAIAGVGDSSEVVLPIYNLGALKLLHVDASNDALDVLSEVDVPDAQTFPHTANVDPDGRFVLLGNEGDREVMIIDLTDQSVRRIAWLPEPGPTALVVQP